MPEKLTSAERWSRFVCLSLGSYALVGGVVSFIGWSANIPRLTDWNNNGISIQPNATIAVMSAGSALIFLTSGYRRVAGVLGSFVAFIGGSALFQYLSGINLGIDSLLMFNRSWGRVGVLVPGRMGPPGATSWTLIGLAFVLTSLLNADRRNRRDLQAIVLVLSLLTASIVSLSLIGYLYGASVLYSVPTRTVIAFQTATFILAISLGLVTGIRERGPMRLITEDSSAGILTRRILPAVILFPILIGFFRLAGEQAGLYDTAFGSALRTLSEIGLFLILLWWTGSALSRQAKRRTEAVEALRQSEQHLTDTLESITDGFVTLDRNWRFTYVNHEAESLLSKSRSELLGKVCWEIFPESNEGSARRELSRAVAEQVSVSFEEFNPVMQRWFSNRAYPKAGGGLTVYFQDITEQKRVEEELLAAGERFRFMAESMPQKIFTARPNGEVDYFNQQWTEFTGLSFEQIRNWGWTQFVHADDVEENVRVWQHAIDTGDPFRFEHRFRRADGEYRWHLSHAVAMRNSQGKVLMWIGSNTDIDDVKRDEAEREGLVSREREARRQAETASRLKDEFLATVSHELRTSLNAILGWAHMLHRGSLDEKNTAHGLEVIERNAKAQNQLIADLLDVSRIITGKFRFEQGAVELIPIIESALETARSAAEAKGIQLRFLSDPAAGLISGDATRLQQVVWNLLSNAVKYTPRNGHVEVQLKRQETSAAIVVQDSGEGIKPEFLPYIFDRFRQADGTTTRQHGGLGLGLAIVRQLVESHGGTVHASSEGVGRGATFTVTLPLMALRSEDGNGRDKRSEIPLAQFANLSNLRVLVVDDEPDARELLTLALTHCGAEVRSAASVSEAVDMLDQWKPDVLVSDIAMAGEDGYDLIRKVRARERESGSFIPALALTGYAGGEDAARALAAGYQMHLSKPVSPNELIALIASLAAKSSTRLTARGSSWEYLGKLHQLGYGFSNTASGSDEGESPQGWLLCKSSDNLACEADAGYLCTRKYVWEICDQNSQHTTCTGP